MHCPKLFIVVLQELDCLPNYLHVFMIRVMGCYHVTKFRYSTPEIALPEAVYCCFTRTTLFTTMFIVVIVVYSLKSMCIQSFILIGSCVSELHGHLS